MKRGAKVIRKEVPVGVKIISILVYIWAVFSVFFGLFILLGTGSINSIVSKAIGTDVPSALFFVVGIIFIALGVLGLFIGRGLWKARSWARITVISLACLGILLDIISIFQGQIASIFSIIIKLIIGGYLLLNNKVNEVFK